MLAALLLLLATSPVLAIERVVIADDVVAPPTLDPFLEFGEKNHTLLQQMLEGLVRMDPEGRVEPALAESWEQPDPLRLRFHLRKGVRFHNGEELESGSVRFSIEHYIDPAGLYPGRGFFASLERVETPDPYTVDLVTRWPDGLLLRRLAGLITVVPAGYYRVAGSTGFSEHPVGTGPFQFSARDGNKAIILEAFRGYRVPAVPEVDELEFRFIPAEAQVDALFAGKVDILMEMPGTATLRAKQNAKTTVLKKESFYTVGGTLNVSRWPMSDMRFRKALNYAINRDELIRYDLMGNGKPLATLSMRGQVGHDPGLKPYPFDPAKANDLLREMGLPIPVRLKTLVRAQGQRTAKILGRQLEKVGIVLDAVTGTESDLFRLFKEQEWDLGIAGVPDPTGHSSFIQSILLYSRSPYSIFKSTEFDRRMEDVSSTLAEAEQETKGRALDRYMYDNALSLFTYQRVKTYGVSRRVRFTPYVTGMPHFFSLKTVKAGAVLAGEAH